MTELCWLFCPAFDNVLCAQVAGGNIELRMHERFWLQQVVHEMVVRCQKRSKPFYAAIIQSHSLWIYMRQYLDDDLYTWETWVPT